MTDDTAEQKRDPGSQELAPASEREPESGPASERRQESSEALFAFTCSKERLLVPAALVVTVVAYEPPSRVPRAPAHISGLMPYGEGSLAVLDLGRFLELPQYRSPGEAPDTSMLRVVTVTAGDLEAGLLCEQAHGVLSVATSQLENPSSQAPGRLSEFLHAEVTIDEQRFGVLDLGVLLEAARARSRREAPL